MRRTICFWAVSPTKTPPTGGDAQPSLLERVARARSRIHWRFPRPAQLGKLVLPSPNRRRDTREGSAESFVHLQSNARTGRTTMRFRSVLSDRCGDSSGCSAVSLHPERRRRDDGRHRGARRREAVPSSFDLFSFRGLISQVEFTASAPPRRPTPPRTVGPTRTRRHSVRRASTLAPTPSPRGLSLVGVRQVHARPSQLRRRALRGQLGTLRRSRRRKEYLSSGGFSLSRTHLAVGVRQVHARPSQLRRPPGVLDL